MDPIPTRGGLKMKGGSNPRWYRRQEDIKENQKRCNRCKEYKNFSDFFSHPTTPSGCGAYCKPCDILKRKEHSLKTKYGITLEQYHQKMSSQDNKCAICRCSLNSLGTHQVNTDHNHNTNVFRGILCDGCNRAIGLIKDNPETAQRMAGYLR